MSTTRNYETAGAVRDELEVNAEVPHCDERTDSVGRQQLASKSPRELEAVVAADFTADDLRALRYCVEDVVACRRIAGNSAPAAVYAVHPRLLAAITAMSARGHENRSADPQLDNDDEIGTAEAARLLRCSPRHVARIAADLDGCRPARDWIFRRHTVIDYAQAKTKGTENEQL